MARIVVGITGASGIVLACHVVRVLAQTGHAVELVMTRDAGLTAVEELGADFATPEKIVARLAEGERENVRIHKISDFTAPIASGSYRVDGMVIVPCSMGTLAAVACGIADNLLRRAADVCLKERRRLVVVPRETPLSEIHLDNMLKITRMGGVIVPPIPAWYNKPTSLEDVEMFVVGRTLDALGIDNDVYRRWGC